MQGKTIVLGMELIHGIHPDPKNAEHHQKASRALAALHRQYVLHNDLRRQNIMIRDGGNAEAVILDLHMASQCKSQSSFFEEQRFLRQNVFEF